MRDISDSSRSISKFPNKSLQRKSFRNFFWDPEEKKILTRTCSAWRQVTAFYIVFYSGVTMLFAICMFALLLVVNEDSPYYTLEDSLIGTNPGMGFRPMPENGNNLIQLRLSSNSSIVYWTQNIDIFLEPYRLQYNNIVDCYYNTSVPFGQFCAFILDSLGPFCTHDNEYGFRIGSPCVFLKLNKIFGWIPIPYKKNDPLPTNMPQELKYEILGTPLGKELVWISCEGEDETDQINLGDIEYWPQQGFPLYYYPYKNTPNYISPLVAIQLKNPAKNVAITIQCQAWAKNLHYYRVRAEIDGGTEFKILIHE